MALSVFLMLVTWVETIGVLSLRALETHRNSKVVLIIMSATHGSSQNQSSAIRSKITFRNPDEEKQAGGAHGRQVGRSRATRWNSCLLGGTEGKSQVEVDRLAKRDDIKVKESERERKGDGEPYTKQLLLFAYESRYRGENSGKTAPGDLPGGAAGR